MSEPTKADKPNVVDLQAARDALLARQETSTSPGPIIENVPGADALPSRQSRLRSVKPVIDEVPGMPGTGSADEQPGSRHPSASALRAGDRVVVSSPGDPGYDERLAEWQTKQDQIASAAAKVGHVPLETTVQPPSEQQ